MAGAVGLDSQNRSSESSNRERLIAFRRAPRSIFFAIDRPFTGIRSPAALNFLLAAISASFASRPPSGIRLS